LVGAATVEVFVTVEAPRIPKLQAAPKGMPPGVVHVGEVVKVHTKSLASGFPAASLTPLAPLFTVAV
jgi:hypothetical protein